MKRPFFLLFIALFPLICLVALEMVLRGYDYGGDTSIVATVEHAGKTMYTMNQLVGRRYFQDNGFLYYRKCDHDYFDVKKAPNTIRVFCFGESSTAGFPFEYNARPSEFLRDRLVAAYPGRNIEVINTAIAATNSYTVLEFVKEMVHYEPDLFIIYLGHNEFYGAFGVGSSVSIGKERWMIRSYLWLQQFKVTQLVRNAVGSLKGFAANSEGVSEEPTLMEQMVREKAIPYGSGDFQTALRSFASNYREMLETANEYRVPVIVSSLVSNERGLPPFVSQFDVRTPASARANWEQLFSRGDSLENAKRYEEAIQNFQKVLAIDSMPARAYFHLGRCYEQLAQYSAARASYQEAVDRDALRFRAPGLFNKTIKQLTREYHAPFADVDSMFRAHSPQAILGNELLTEHIHPTLQGYFLMAKSWYETAQQSTVLPHTGIDISDSLLWQKAAVTDVDRDIGKLKIAKLTSREPFESGGKEFSFQPTTIPEEAAYLYVAKKELSWSEAHLYASKKFSSSGRIPEAIKECDAILKVDESNPRVFSLRGDLFSSLALWKEAEANYSEAISHQDDPYPRFRLGSLKLDLNDPNGAIEEFQRSLALIQTANGQLSTQVVGEIRYALAKAYLATGRQKEAQSELEIVLRRNPTDKKAAALLLQLRQF